MEHIDSLLHARWVIPVEPDNQVLDHHTVAIHAGRIVAVLPQQQARQLYKATSEVELPQHVLIPGLINMHTHAGMTLFRGLADDLPLMEWLTQYIWPAEGTWVNHEFVRDGTELAIAEMIRGGITCFNDMYFFPDETARAANHAGIRAHVGMLLIDFPTAWAKDADEYIYKGLELHDYYRHHPLIHTTFAPHAPYTVSDEPLERIKMLAEELDVPIHMHIHETADEVARGVAQYQQRPLQRLDNLGLLSPRLLAVHMTQLNDAEIQRYAATGGHVLHCPESNLKLASGFCPLAKLIAAGVNVALGTDGAASNNDLDLLGEMRTAALVAKAVAHDAAVIPAATALRMATLNGARALGMEHELGSLTSGKFADITAIDLGELETEPVFNPLSHVVYCASRHQVTDVWVAGKPLLRERGLTTLDINAIRSKARAWRDKIAAGSLITK